MRIGEISGMRGAVLMTVALSASAVMAQPARSAAPPKPQKSTAAPKVPAAQGITPVNVLIKNSCDHQVSPPTAKLHTTTKDLLRWRIQNNCGQDQPVLICVYEKTTNQLKNPFKPCAPDPSVHDVGKIFTVASHGHETFECATEDPSFHGKYRKQVRVGAAEVPSTGCPAVFQSQAPSPGTKSPVKIFMHALDIDVVP
jgi:hypothetical protein